MIYRRLNFQNHDFLHLSSNCPKTKNAKPRLAGSLRNHPGAQKQSAAWGHSIAECGKMLSWMDDISVGQTKVFTVIGGNFRWINSSLSRMIEAWFWAKNEEIWSFHRTGSWKRTGARLVPPKTPRPACSHSQASQDNIWYSSFSSYSCFYHCTQMHKLGPPTAIVGEKSIQYMDVHGTWGCIDGHGDTKLPTNTTVLECWKSSTREVLQILHQNNWLIRPHSIFALVISHWHVWLPEGVTY